MTKPNRVAVAALVNDLAQAHARYYGGRVNALGCRVQAAHMLTTAGPLACCAQEDFLLIAKN